MAEEKHSLYISGLYSTSVDHPTVAVCDVVKHDTYGEDRCGGSCTRVVTKKPLGKETEFLFCVPYAKQKHLYLYSFYSNEDVYNQRLWELLEDHKKSGATVARGSDVPEYVVLCNELLDTFDHTNRCLLEEDPADTIEGTVEYAHLELMAWKDVRRLLREMKRPLLIRTGNFDARRPEIHFISLDEKDFESVVVKAIEGLLIEFQGEYGEGSFPQDRCDWWVTDSEMKFTINYRHGSHFDEWTFELENCGNLHDKLLPMLKASPIIQKYSKSE